MEKITVGMTVRLVKEISGGAPVSTATMIYIDEFNWVFIGQTADRTVLPNSSCS